MYEKWLEPKQRRYRTKEIRYREDQERIIFGVYNIHFVLSCTITALTVVMKDYSPTGMWNSYKRRIQPFIKMGIPKFVTSNKKKKKNASGLFIVI